MDLRVSLLAVMMLGSACALDETDASSGPDETLSEVQQNIDGCGGWQCGTNSPEIANLGFWEMASPTVEGVMGPPNSAGIQIMAFVKQTGPTTYAGYLPKVVKGKLIGSPMSTNVAPHTVVLRGDALIGGYFLLMSPAGAFKLFVKDVGQVMSWARPPASLVPIRLPVILESYKLDWSNLQGEVLKNVCTHPGQRDDLHLMDGPLAYHTLLFEGDRIRPESKEVYDVDTQWFNLGCAGSTLAKMALTGHTEAAKLARTFTTTLAERQTMLKMLTADYCGDGTPYTVQGQPLNWADDHGTMKMIALAASPPRPVVREARWGSAGPICLDEPRVDTHWTSLGEATFGDAISVYEQAKAHCPLKMPPSCSGTALGLDGAHLITATEPFAGPP
jgi:hypothetical protein